MDAVLHFQSTLNLNADTTAPKLAVQNSTLPKHAILLLQGLVTAVAMFFGSFLGANWLTDAVVSPIGHLEGLSQAAGLVGIYTCLAALPVIMYVGHRKSARAACIATALAGLFLGMIFAVAIL